MTARSRFPGRRAWAPALLPILAALLAACQAPPVAPTLAPTAIPVYWDERAAVDLIRVMRWVEPAADADFIAPVPDCTIFGDERARWVTADPAGDAPGRLLESPVDGEALAALARTVADSGFFELAAHYGDDSSGPVRELHIRLEGVGSHTVRVAGAVAAPPPFEELFGLCDSLRQPDAASEILPDGGWIYAFPLARPAAFHQEWPDGEVPALLNFVEQPRWLDGEIVTQVWIAARDHGAQASFVSLEEPYRVVVRVPGISPDTPRRPRDTQELMEPLAPWPTEPDVPIFVARFTGGLPTPYRYIGANAVDACTVYGDGRVIVSELPIGEVQEGHMGVRDLTAFMEQWLDLGFLDPLPEETPTPLPFDMIVQEVTLTLNDGSSPTRLFPLNTPYISSVRNPCERLADLRPVEVVGGYLWAEAIGPMTRFVNDMDYALVQWPQEYEGLENLTEPLWHGPEPGSEEEESRRPSVEALQFAWNNLHGLHDRPTVLFLDDGIAYAVYVDVPGVTVRDAPLFTAGDMATEEPSE